MYIKIIKFIIFAALIQILLGVLEIYIAIINANINMLGPTYEIYIFCIIKSILNILSGFTILFIGLISYCVESFSIKDKDTSNIKIYLIIYFIAGIWGLIRFINQSFYDIIEILLFQQILYIETIIFLGFIIISCLIKIYNYCNHFIYYNKDSTDKLQYILVD